MHGNYIEQDRDRPRRKQMLRRRIKSVLGLNKRKISTRKEEGAAKVIALDEDSSSKSSQRGRNGGARQEKRME